MEQLAAIVLAAGKGSRMNSDTPKVLSKTKESTLIKHVLSSLSDLKLSKCIVVTGFKKDLVEAEIESFQAKLNFPIEFVEQAEQLGTGHAVQMAVPNLKDFSGDVIITYGDMPLIETNTYQQLVDFHVQNRNTLSLVSLKNNQNHYGRIVRDEVGKPLKIVEYKDCTSLQKSIQETNTGVYLVDSAFLAPAVESLENNNAQKEYYITDIFEKAVSEGQNVDCLAFRDEDQFLGVNTLYDLSQVNQVLNKKVILRLSLAGVYFTAPETCIIDSSVKIDKNVQIGPNCQIYGDTIIENGTKIEGSSLIIDSQISKNCLIKLSCRIEKSKIDSDCQIGPFANLRENTQLESKVKIGNFVETKNSKLDTGVKASHLSYLGDSEIGSNSNIGAGTITCNYDGKNKHRTKIAENCFIGSNSSLVAPLDISKNSLIGAGTVLTKNVPESSLAITRAELKVKAKK